MHLNCVDCKSIHLKYDKVIDFPQSQYPHPNHHQKTGGGGIREAGIPQK